MTDLRDLQKRFQQYLINGDASIEEHIVSADNALAEHRLGVYYNAYRIRLIDSLAIDYQALEQYLGREKFEYLALDYLEHYPSNHPSVRWFGRHLATYLSEIYRGDEREFLHELASYEWLQTLVFDAASGAPLAQLEDMALIPPADWPELRFGFKPAVRWIDLYWNIPPIENAYDQGETPPPKNRADHPQRWLLWRREMKTYWRSLDVHEAWALEQAASGADFAAICAGLVEWVDESQIALIGAGFLKQWISDQLLLSLESKKA